MRRYFFIFIALFVLTFYTPAYSAPTVFFSTGWESDVALAGKTANHEHFSHSGEPSCVNNSSYCNGGYVDAVTGYNVPYDIPGTCFFNACDDGPSFNFVEPAPCADEAEITTVDKVGGSKSLRIYNDNCYIDAVSRVQLNFTSEDGEAPPHDFTDGTLTKFYVKWTSLPSIGEWNLWYEFYRYTGAYPGRLMFTNDGGTLKLLYFGGSTSYGRKKWGTETDISSVDFLNKWTQVIVYHKQDGSAGRCIVWFKIEDEDPVKVMDWTGDNDDDGILLYIMPVKAYGNGNADTWTYYDDFVMYIPDGETMPAWDGTNPVISSPEPTSEQPCDGASSTDAVSWSASEDSTCRWSEKGADTCTTAYGSLDNLLGSTVYTFNSTTNCGVSKIYIVKCQSNATSLDSNCLEITHDVAAAGGTPPQPAPGIIAQIGASGNLTIIGGGNVSVGGGYIEMLGRRLVDSDGKYMVDSDGKYLTGAN